jgi:hypothetical protein
MSRLLSKKIIVYFVGADKAAHKLIHASSKT